VGWAKGSLAPSIPIVPAHRPAVICHVSRHGEVVVIEGKRRGGVKR
jgi:hypothetical protein